jgi:Chalcone isomerase-like
VIAACNRRTLLAALAVAPLAALARSAPPPEVPAEVPGARLQGSGRLTFFGLHVYDARLWVADGVGIDRLDALPHAIELEYARTLYGRLIAERSLGEMKRVPGITAAQAERWLAWMTQTFPDVNPGDRITGVHRPAESARVFVNGTLRGELRDAEFARRFFAIWLGPQTSEPGLRDRLLGASKAGS